MRLNLIGDLIYFIKGIGPKFYLFFNASLYQILFFQYIVPLVDAINITPFIYTKLLLHIRKSILLKTCKNKTFLKIYYYYYFFFLRKM